MKKIPAITLLATILVGIIPAIIYLGVLFWTHDFNPDFLKIDACLDAGGSWDYTNRVAIYSDKQFADKEIKTEKK